MFVSSCAPSAETNPYVTSCILPSDQVATILTTGGHWQVTPISVAFHAGDFTQSEQAAIGAAANTWNSFYSTSIGGPIINIVGTSEAPKPTTVCAETLVAGGAFNAPVVIYKDFVWPFSSEPNAIAITTTCPSDTSPLKDFYGAIIEVNYQNFFVAGRPLPDLQSILTHEFGHLVGLGHSCEAAGGNGIPVCATASPDYTSAVMGPIFTFNSQGYGQVKQSLTQNDQGRANCLYDPSFNGKATTGP